MMWVLVVFLNAGSASTVISVDGIASEVNCQALGRTMTREIKAQRFANSTRFKCLAVRKAK